MSGQMRSYGDFEACNEALSRICGAYRVTCERWWEFRGGIQVRQAGSLEFADIEFSGGTVIRDHRDQHYRGDQYFLVCQAAGSARMRQRGSEAELAAGDCTLIDSRYPSVFQVGAGFHQYSFHLPAQALVERFGTATLPVARLIGARGAGAILSRMLQTAVQNASTLNGVDLTGVMLDLLAVALGLGKARPVAASLRGPDALSVPEVVRYIDARLQSPELSPAAIAAHFNTSVRGLYRLIGAEGSAPAALIWSRRLARARELLEQANAGVPIIDIALDCGFKDGAHFSRAYRKAFGHPPRAARRRPIPTRPTAAPVGAFV